MLACLADFGVTVYNHSALLQTSNYTFDPLADMPADFGPPIPAQGVEGFLIVSCAQCSRTCKVLAHTAPGLVSW